MTRIAPAYGSKTFRVLMNDIFAEPSGRKQLRLGRTAFRLYVGIVIVCICSSSSFALASQLQGAPVAAVAAFPGEPEWARNAWTGADSGAQDIRQVVTLEKSRSLTLQDIDKLKSAAELPGSSSISQAVYGEALFLGFHRELDVSANIDSFCQSVPMAESNVSRAYARGVFLACSTPSHYGNEWVSRLGRRLMLENPHDYYVLVGLCCDSLPVRSSGDNAAALDYVAKVKALQPRNPLSYYAEYVVYFYRATGLADVRDFDATIAALKVLDEMEGHTSKTIPGRLKSLKRLRADVIRLRSGHQSER